ncbi:MFS transporter [Arthrobacter sp. AK01]|uniref:MFS transporter n=1 Tax=Micrococcaceae TaxID=1268 RepID=UPI001E2FDEDD|nr:MULTISPECIES: MFS transporter [Micrococcaceae]MCD4850886.1 MFS transporter [Arthrobacter sp. AK01]MCP1414214.1 hypothetical protein [Paenarthrobacter sp. A20]
MLLDQTAGFIIPVSVYAQSGNVALSGIVFLVQWAPRVLSTGLLGTLLDKYTSLRIFATSDLVRGLLCLIVAVSDSMVTLFLGAALLMFFGGIAVLGIEKVISLDDLDSREVSQSHQQVALQLTQVAGPLLGGMLILFLQQKLTFLILAGGFVISALSAIAFRTTKAQKGDAKARRAVHSSLFLGVLQVWRNKGLMKLLSMGVMVNFIAGLGLAIAPAVVIGEFAGNESTVGMVSGVGALIGAASAISLATYVSRGGKISLWIVKASFILMFVSGLGMGLAGNAIIFAAAFGLWSAGLTVFSVWLRTERLKIVPAAEVGSTIGAFVAILLLSVPLSGAVLALLGGLMSPRLIILLSVALVGLVVVLMSIRYGMLRHARAASGQPREEDSIVQH